MIYNIKVIKNQEGAWTQKLKKTSHFHLQSNCHEVLFQNAQVFFSLYTL